MAKRQRDFKKRGHARLRPMKRMQIRTGLLSRVITRCDLANMKIAYDSQDDARSSAEYIEQERGTPLRVYRCGSHYHLTSNV